MRTRREDFEEKRQRRNRVIISITIIILMVFSSVGYAFYYFTGGVESVKYQGHTFKPVVSENGITGYTTKIDGKEVYFYSSPLEAASIEVPLGFGDALQQSYAIIFLFDPNDNLTQYYDQFRYEFSQAIPKQQGAGVTKPSTTYQFPVLNCANATQGYPFIYFTEGNKSITYDKGCYVIAGDKNSYALLRDRILLAYYGIN